MAYNISGALQTVFATLDDNTATTVFTAESATLIAAISVGDNATSPSATVAVYDTDSSLAYILKRAVAAPFVYSDPFVLPQGWEIRVTSSDASGKLDILVTYVANVAAATLRA